MLAPNAPAQPERIRRGEIIAIVAIGVIAREGLAWFSFGSADVAIFRSFSDRISEHGMLWLFANEPSFNHPPLAGWWAWIARLIADQLDALAPARWSWFSFVFKQPMIVADAIACVVLWRVWSDRDRARTGLSVAAIYAFSPLSILLSAHHGNTDPIYATLCLLAAYTICQHRSFLLAGLVLGAAINVKFIPVLLVPVLGALCRDRRSLAKYAIGLAVAAIPFLPVVTYEPQALVRNVLRYSSTVDYWGVNQFLLETIRVPRFSAVAQTAAQAYNDRGRWIVIGAIALLILMMRRRAWGADRAYSAVAVAAAMFLVLSPGFGLQYLAFAGPLVLAVRPGAGFAFALAGGLFALFNYWLNWTGGLPFDSTGIATPPRAPGPQFGLLAWAALVAVIVGELKRPARRKCSESDRLGVH